MAATAREGRPGGGPGDEGIGQRVAQKALQQRAGGRERAADERSAKHARKPQLADDRAAHIVRSEERREHVTGSDRDRSDEDPRGRAHDERGHEEREDRKRAHYRKSSGWTSFAYASAASPTRGPGRLMRFGSMVKMRLFLTAAMIDQPCRATTSSGLDEYASAARTMISGSLRRISSAESCG